MVNLFAKERLCLQVLHGKVSAFVEYGGKLTRECIIHEPCENASAWPRFFDQVIKELKYKGSHVSIVFSDERAHFLVVPTPPMKSKDLLIFLGRKAHHEWKIRIPMRYAWTELKVRDSRAVLLQIVPEDWVNAFVESCRDHGMQPIHIMTANAAAIRHLKVMQGITGLVALDTGYSALFVVCRGGEQPVLVRELSVSWHSKFDGPLRVAQEIQRTQLFAKQQLGSPIESITLLGEGSSLLAQVSENILGSKPEVDENPVVWALPLQPRMKSSTDNLLTSRELRHRMEKFNLVITVCLTFLFLFALSLAALRMEKTLVSIDQAIKEGKIQQTIDGLNDQKEALTIVQTEIKSNYALGSIISEQSNRPVPGWIAGIISDLVPDGMILTQLWVHPDTTNGWVLEIGGQIPRNPIRSEKLLAEFQDRIAALPTRYEERISWKTVWVDNLKYGSSWESDEATKRFLLQGVIR